MSLHYRYQKQILLGIILLIIIAIGGYFIYIKLFNSEKVIKQDKNIVLATTKKNENKNKENSDIAYQVDIKGEVTNPGLYSITEGKRVMDVIEMAGGLTNQADVSVINLSKKVFDEMVIIIYSQEEVLNFTFVKEQEKLKQEKCVGEEELKNDACITVIDDIKENKISLNKATVEELDMLPGIGEAKAKDIITYREEHGEFKVIEDIKNVNGIGDSLFAKIKDYLTL